ncbi:MAG TPA: hypothetical protein VG845_08980 [Dehalococcoidia bacterium]|jgi:hypothetical protein|nr:hypothetical protein [Dehalococcoidia bacterium]
MLLDQESGDHTCFTCGHVKYAVEPLERHERTRAASHGGQNLN